MAVKATALITLTRVNDGAAGPKGTDGKGIKSTSVTYQAWDNGTNPPPSNSGWVTTPPKTTASKPYLWTKTVLTYTDNTSSPPSYSVGATPEGVEEKVDKNIKDQIAASEKTMEQRYQSAIDVTKEDITATITNVKKELENGVTTSIQDISNKFSITSEGFSSIQTTIVGLDSAINGVKADPSAGKEAQPGLKEIMKYISWDGDDLTLGNTSQPFKCKISSSELAFYENLEKVAWISNKELYILTAIIAKSIGCGNFQFIDEGDLGFSLK